MFWRQCWWRHLSLAPDTICLYLEWFLTYSRNVIACVSYLRELSPCRCVSVEPKCVHKNKFTNVHVWWLNCEYVHVWWLNCEYVHVWWLNCEYVHVWCILLFFSSIFWHRYFFSAIDFTLDKKNSEIVCGNKYECFTVH